MKVNLNKKKVIVGMSGGVDSSVSLYLLKKAGYEPIGVSLKYDVWKNPCNKMRENICCSEESLKIAKKICKSLGIEHKVVDVAEEFKNKVIDYFVYSLKQNQTPSPCVFCNLNVKFKTLLDVADKEGAKFVATGHYARIRQKEEGGFELLKAKDKLKDQTYSLTFLPQKWLSRIMFPLGEMTKEEVYKIASEQKGFEVFKKRKQSQDFCFVSGNALTDFLEKEIGVKEGRIVDASGKKLGEHKGLHFYTIGQRKGIRLPGGPYFVVDKDEKNNLLIVSKNEATSFKKEILLSPVSFISDNPPESNFQVQAKLRSTQHLAKAILCPYKKGYKLVFYKGQRAVAPGQIAVFYEDEICLGAGVISSSRP